MASLTARMRAGWEKVGGLSGRLLSVCLVHLSFKKLLFWVAAFDLEAELAFPLHSAQGVLRIKLMETCLLCTVMIDLYFCSLSLMMSFSKQRHCLLISHQFFPLLLPPLLPSTARGLWKTPSPSMCIEEMRMQWQCGFVSVPEGTEPGSPKCRVGRARGRLQMQSAGALRKETVPRMQCIPLMALETCMLCYFHSLRMMLPNQIRLLRCLWERLGEWVPCGAR